MHVYIYWAVTIYLIRLCGCLLTSYGQTNKWATGTDIYIQHTAFTKLSHEWSDVDEHEGKQKQRCHNISLVMSAFAQPSFLKNLLSNKRHIWQSIFHQGHKQHKGKRIRGTCSLKPTLAALRLCSKNSSSLFFLVIQLWHRMHSHYES